PIVELVREVRVGHAAVGQLAALAEPDRALVPKTAHADDVADLAVVDALDGFQVTGLMAALRAGGDVQARFFGLLVGIEHFANAAAVHADGLFGEEVFLRRDNCLYMDRTEAG